MGKILVCFDADVWDNNSFVNMIETTDLITDEIQIIDLTECPEMAVEYDIRGLPTIIIYEDGVETRRNANAKLSVEELKTFVGN